MKRIMLLLVVAVMCLGCIAPAFAGRIIPFMFGGTSSSFVKSSPDATSVGADWRVSYWQYSNLSSSRVASVKIYHAPGVYASHTWNYSSTSTKYHPYTAYGYGDTVYMGIKKKSGTGSIDIGGDFEP